MAFHHFNGQIDEVNASAGNATELAHSADCAARTAGSISTLTSLYAQSLGFKGPFWERLRPVGLENQKGNQAKIEWNIDGKAMNIDENPSFRAVESGFRNRFKSFALRAKDGAERHGLRYLERHPVTWS